MQRKTQDPMEGQCLSAGLGIPPEELNQVAGEREGWVSLLGSEHLKSDALEMFVQVFLHFVLLIRTS